MNKTICVIIFTYNRIDMLRRTLASLYGNVDNIYILDDASDYILEGYNIHQNELNGGRGFFWEQWQKAFNLVSITNYDYYVFMPDDFVNMDVDRLKEMTNTISLMDDSFVLNLINDGRVNCWSATKVISYHDFMKIGFTDCGFITHRSNIEKLNYNIEPIPLEYLVKIGSSGVGMQLTKRFKEQGVNFYKPNKSFCYHGEHESKMHQKERIKNPLISI